MKLQKFLMFFQPVRYMFYEGLKLQWRLEAATKKAGFLTGFIMNGFLFVYSSIKRCSSIRSRAAFGRGFLIGIIFCLNQNLQNVRIFQNEGNIQSVILLLKNYFNEK